MDTLLVLAGLASVGFLLFGFTQLPYFLGIKTEIENSIKKVPLNTDLDNILPEIGFKFPKSTPKLVNVQWFYFRGRKVIIRT